MAGQTKFTGCYEFRGEGGYFTKYADIHQGRVSSALRSGEGFVAKGRLLETQEIRKKAGRT